MGMGQVTGKPHGIQSSENDRMEGHHDIVLVASSIDTLIIMTS